MYFSSSHVLLTHFQKGFPTFYHKTEEKLKRCLLKKIQIPFEIVMYGFFSFENKPLGSKSSAAGGQNRVLPGGSSDT